MEWVGLILGILINAIVVGVFVGRQTKTIESNKELSDTKINSVNDKVDLEIAHMHNNHREIVVTVGELQKTINRFSRELNQLVGFLKRD